MSRARISMAALLVLATALVALTGVPTLGAARGGQAGSTIPNLHAIKAQIVAYHDSGIWDGEIEAIAREARQYLEVSLDTGGRPAIVFDIDETVLSNYAYYSGAGFPGFTDQPTTWIEPAMDTPIQGTHDLYRYAVGRGVAVFLISGRDENLRAATERNLRQAGFAEWQGLLLQPDTDMNASVIPFKSGARRRIAEQGYRSLVNVGDQESDLAGGYAERVYKLPNPMYFIL